MTLGGNARLVLGALAAAGITSTRAQANVLGQVETESNFNPRSENLNWSADTLFRIFGPGGGNRVRFPTREDAEALAAQGPEAIGNVIYGGRMGNAPNEGHRYRGRGLIQLTGRDAYARASADLGIDLLGNPDLANDPDVAAKLIPWFFLTYKGMTPEQMEDGSAVTRAVGAATRTGPQRQAAADRFFSLLGSPAAAATPEAPPDPLLRPGATAKPRPHLAIPRFILSWLRPRAGG